MTGSSKSSFRSLDPPLHQKFDLGGFVGLSFARPQKYQKNKLTGIHQNLKESKFDAKGFNCDAFLMPCVSPTLGNFPDCLNLSICNKYNAKTSFYHFRSFILASKTNQQIMFKCQVWKYLGFVFNGRCWDPLKILCAPKRTKINQVAPKCL